MLRHGKYAHAQLHGSCADLMAETTLPAKPLLAKCHPASSYGHTSSMSRVSQFSLAQTGCLPQPADQVSLAIQLDQLIAHSGWSQDAQVCKEQRDVLCSPALVSATLTSSEADVRSTAACSGLCCTCCKHSLYTKGQVRALKVILLIGAEHSTS